MIRALILFVCAFGASVIVSFAFFMGRPVQSGRDDASGAPQLPAPMRTSQAPAINVGDTSEDWPLIDPDGFLAYVRSRDGIDATIGGLLDALSVVPDEVLEISAQYPAVRIGPDETLEEAAIVAVTERDPAVALAYLEALASTDRYIRLRGVFAGAWARRDPDEALSWAESLEPAAPGVVASVIGWTAATDVEAALSLLETFDVPANHPAVRQGVARPEAIARTIVRQIVSNPERARIAEVLLQRRTARSLIALQELIDYWAEIDPTGATAWVVRSVDRLPPELPRSLVGRIAATDVEASVHLVNQLPSDMRLLVAGPVSRELALADPIAAANWIEQFKEYSDYRDLYLGALNAVASSDPMAAGAMLASVPPAVGLKDDADNELLPERILAESWAAQDIAAAASWSQRIEDPEAREQAGQTIARYWLKADPDGAQRWALSLSPGSSTQAVLRSLVFRAAIENYSIEPRILDRAFGSEPEQQENLSRTIMAVAQLGDTRRAMSLADEWISDQDVRRQTMQEIELLTDRYSIEQFLSE